MKWMISFFAAAVLCIGCRQQKTDLKVTAKNTIDSNWLDAIIKNSDSSYTKPYRRTDFVTATFYLNKKDTTVCQVMKDSANTIRQVIIAKKNTRTFFAQYYSNGQLQAHLPLDAFGQYNGEATYYFINGNVESTGNYLHGLKNGEWKSFNNNGQLISALAYDANGQVSKP